ncbi:SMI1/KNR4 family protein [Achromobacter xylosoxidans]|uniref:SMI1/KNR4 family protein n=1 Tax=Alcaligenes xylosoxydans xylosoxydans TaxID=85698 RepID=UPI001EEA1B1B|nr:SMI1/KNR4 family protein [Achromobacter xylosoxidans]WOB73648.1 SMI1/KNR4 family protein [Achromobacter xylosoxidans]
MIFDINSVVLELKGLRLSLPKAQVLPSDKLLDAYEKELGFIFPDDYRYFLKEASDSILNGKDSLRVTPGKDSPRELINNANEAWGLGVPRDWLPFCEDNGNYYCLTKCGEVRFWSHDGLSDESWPNLATWIKKVWIDEE